MENAWTKREKIMGIIIIVLTVLIIFGGSFFGSELKNCKVGENEEEKEAELTSIDMNTFKTLLKGKELSIVYLARPGCSFCQKQEPIMKKIAGKYEKITINYLNTDNLEEKDFKQIFALNTELFGKDGSQFGTPTIILVKNGKIVDSIVGYNVQSKIESFLQENKIIK